MHRTRPNRWRVGILALLALGAALIWPLLPAMPPQEVSLSAPAPLVERLRLHRPPVHLLWSLDEQYLAIPCSGDRKTEIVVLDMREGKEVARFPAPEDERPRAIWGEDERTHAVWAEDGRLWIRGKREWRVYAPPFQETRPTVSIPDRLPPGTSLEEFDWAFRPEGELLVTVREQSLLQNGASLPLGAPRNYRLAIRKQDKVLYDQPFIPREQGDQRHAGSLTFSPDARKLAFTVDGWVGLETPGAEELWTVDLATNTVRCLHVGKSEWWRIFDFPVQHMTPSWTPDGRELVVGDAKFGLERIDAETGWRWHLLPPEWGSEPQAGRDWVAYLRFKDYAGFGMRNLFREEVALVSRDGRRWGKLPGPISSQSVYEYAWNREGTQLALLTSGLQGKDSTLLVWKAPAN